MAALQRTTLRRPENPISYPFHLSLYFDIAYRELHYADGSAVDLDPIPPDAGALDDKQTELID